MNVRVIYMNDFCIMVDVQLIEEIVVNRCEELLAIVAFVGSIFKGLSLVFNQW